MAGRAALRARVASLCLLFRSGFGGEPEGRGLFGPAVGVDLGGLFLACFLTFVVFLGGLCLLCVVCCVWGSPLSV